MYMLLRNRLLYLRMTPQIHKPCLYQPGDKVPSSRMDNYRYRGPLLSDLSFFEYHMLVQSKRKHDST